MHIVVVGCGRVGTELATHLDAEGHTVAVVDKNARSFRRLPDGFGGTQIEGYGFDRDTLSEAGIDKAVALAAVTNGDNSNILTARVARETFGIEQVVARIYDPRRALIYERLGIPTIATVAWATDQVLRRLLPTAVTTDWVDGTGQVGVVQKPLPAALAGRKLAELNEPGRFSVNAVTRFGSCTIADPTMVGQEGDLLLFSVALDALADLEARLGASTDTTSGGH